MDVWGLLAGYNKNSIRSEQNIPHVLFSSSSSAPPQPTQVQDEIWAIIIIILLFHQLFVVVVTPELLPVFNSIRSSVPSLLRDLIPGWWTLTE